MKININFPVSGDTLSDSMSVNNAVNGRIASLIRFGQAGNSSPHVTLVMGDVADDDVPTISEVVKEFVDVFDRPVMAEFGAPYREGVTGRYIFSDVSVPEAVAAWRSRLREALSAYFMNNARMTDEALHLTLGVLENASDEIDGYLETLPMLRPSTFSRVDLSVAGAKGAKLNVISRLDFRND